MERASFQHFINLALVLGTAGCVGAGQVLWKIAAQKSLGGESITITALSGVLLSPWFLSGGLAYAFGVIFWVIQLSRFPLSAAFALTAGSVFLVVLAADALLFSTPLSFMLVVGGGIVLFGIALTIWS